MCVANQRCSRCRRKTSARHGETGPTPPLLPNSTRKARLFRVQILTRTQMLMTRLGLEVDTAKTRVARLPEEAFDFLGYTVGRFYGKDGRAYIGTRPSPKAVRSLLQRIHERTTRQWYPDSPES